MMFSQLTIVLANSLCMLVIVVEHLLMCSNHVLGGGKVIFLLLQHALCNASFILNWKLCRVPKVMTVLVQHLGCSSIPCWYAGRRHCIAFICI
jgi:hypothetical protein